MSYAGEVEPETVVGTAGTGPWTPASSWVGGSVADAPTYADIIALFGGSTTVDTVAFSVPVLDPVMSIWSLGSPSIDCSFVFTSSEPFTIEAGGPDAEYGGSSVFTNGTPYTVFGEEGNGTLQFDGTFSSISWTNPSAEGFYGFTVGAPGPVPEPSALALFCVGVSGPLGYVWRLRRGRRVGANKNRSGGES